MWSFLVDGRLLNTKGVDQLLREFYAVAPDYGDNEILELADRFIV